jgi:hypothetical protein
MRGVTTGAAGASLLIAMAVTACSNDMHARAARFASAPEFWPDAPASTPSKAPRQLAWKLDEWHAYALDESFTTKWTEGNHISTHFDTTLAAVYRLEPGEAPGSRDVFLDHADYEVRSNAFKAGAHVARDGIAVDRGYGMKPYEPGAQVPFDIPALGARVSTIVVDGPKLVEETNRGYIGFVHSPMNAASLLELPRTQISSGQSWSAVGEVDLGKNGRLTGTVEYVYVGDSACPAIIDHTCAQFRYTAIADGTARGGVTMEGGAAGRIFFDLDVGAIAESRTRIDVRIVGGPKASMEVGGTTRFRATTVDPR